jgi:ketosteroid isomerase-like protein
MRVIPTSIIFLLTAAVHPMAAQGPAGPDPTRVQPVTVATLKAFVNAFNRHDLDAIMSFFADSCTLYTPRGPDPWGERFEGKGAVRQALAGRLSGIPDVHYGDDRHWVSGDLGISWWILTGTTSAGERLRVWGVDLLEFRAGKIVRKDSYWKRVERRAQ